MPAQHGLIIAEWFEEMETAAKGGRPKFRQDDPRFGHRHRQWCRHSRRSTAAPAISGIGRTWRPYRIAGTGSAFREYEKSRTCIRGVEWFLPIFRPSLRLTSSATCAKRRRRAILAASGRGFYLFQSADWLIGDKGKANVKEIDAVQGPLVRQAFTLYAARRVHSLICSRSRCTGATTRMGTAARYRKHAAGLAALLNNPSVSGHFHQDNRRDFSWCPRTVDRGAAL